MHIVIVKHDEVISVTIEGDEVGICKNLEKYCTGEDDFPQLSRNYKGKIVPKSKFLRIPGRLRVFFPLIVAKHPLKVYYGESSTQQRGFYS